MFHCSKLLSLCVLVGTSLCFDLCGAQLREWTNREGKTVIAEYISSSDNHVYIRTGQTTFGYQKNQLSEKDLEYLKQIEKVDDYLKTSMRSVYTDRAGDVRKNNPYAYLDLTKVTVLKASDTESILTLEFAEPMPALENDDLIFRIFVRLDLDLDAATGLQGKGIGADLTISLEGTGADHPWGYQLVYNSAEGRRQKGLVVSGILYSGKELSMTVTSLEATPLKHFGLYITTTANFATVDHLPNIGPIYIDTTKGIASTARPEAQNQSDSEP